MAIPYETTTLNIMAIDMSILRPNPGSALVVMRVEPGYLKDIADKTEEIGEEYDRSAIYKNRLEAASSFTKYYRWKRYG